MIGGVVEDAVGGGQVTVFSAGDEAEGGWWSRHDASLYKGGIKLQGGIELQGGVYWGMGEPTINYLKDENPETFRRRYNNKEFIGKRLSQRRKELGLSQTQVAEYFGTSRVWVSQVELGHGECNAGDLAVFAKLLDIDPVFFIDRVYWQFPVDDPVIMPEYRDNFGLIMTYYGGLTAVLQGALVQAARGLYEAMRFGMRSSLSRQTAGAKEVPPPPRVPPDE